MKTILFLLVTAVLTVGQAKQAATVLTVKAKASAQSAPEADLVWNVPTKGCTGTQTCTYNIYRGTAPGGEGSTPIATGVTTASYADAAVNRGVTYFWQTSAVNNVGESGRSNEATATIPDVPAAPSGLTAVPK